MRRALGLALLVGAFAVPSGAVAAVPGPTVLDFEDQTRGAPTILVYPNGPATFSDSGAGDCHHVREPGGNFGPRYLGGGSCSLLIGFPSGQAFVGLYVRVTPGDGAPGPVAVRAYDAPTGGAIVDQTSVSIPEGTWGAARVRSPSAAIQRVEVEPSNFAILDVDDIGFSSTPQPDVDITGGPAGTAGSGDATFTFAGNQDRMTFSCSLDGGPAEACSSPKSYSGLRDGQHTFTVTGTDRWGAADASPAGRTWTVAGDRDGDGVADGSDNCPDAANAGQGDADADRVGDACEVLPSGNKPVEAGKVVTVKLISGEVLVRLPAGATGSAFTSGLRVPFQSSGFVSLKGVAAVPPGSTLDTRRGTVALTAAINGQRAGSRKQQKREATFRAGIFAIRQARLSRKAKRSKRIPPRAELASPSGAERPCRASGPAKGTAVRSLVTTAKGVFRTVGGAATATPAKGTSTFITTDRCDGTVTEVGRGRVAVIAKRSGKRQVVRAGRAYLVRARLFAARKGRRG